MLPIGTVYSGIRVNISGSTRVKNSPVTSVGGVVTAVVGLVPLVVGVVSLVVGVVTAAVVTSSVHSVIFSVVSVEFSHRTVPLTRLQSVKFVAVKLLHTLLVVSLLLMLLLLLVPGNVAWISALQRSYELQHANDMNEFDTSQTAVSLLHLHLSSTPPSSRLTVACAKHVLP